MREIKFRGAIIGSQEWAYGSVVCKDQFASIVDTDKTGQITKAYIVDRESVGQFTGLIDKNGVEIYEGDLVKWNKSGKSHQIVFGAYSISSDDWGKDFVTPCFCVKYCDGSGYGSIDDDFFVIGNIHENPELIN